MKILRIYPTSINSRFIDEAVATLRQGGLIIYPTDTLYAFGASAMDKGAVESLCRLKGIDPKKQSLSIMCADISQASEYARIDNNAFRILKANLPGPFTFILPVATTLPKVFKERKTVGVRVSSNPIAAELARALGGPLLTSSVQPDSDGSPESVSEAETVAVVNAHTVSLMINGGSVAGEPSTIVDLTDSSDPQIVRAGAGELKL